ncbi:hypothetical protein GYB61_02105 [bacterium]|nr:hypothetical protein [bacterium]
MLRKHQTHLTRLLLALWLAASSVGVLHAAEHALDAEQHICVACVAGQTGAAPASPPAVELPAPVAEAAPATLPTAVPTVDASNNLARGPPQPF